MNHYCTYFDRGFLIQGAALFRSLVAQDPEAVLWVLALDAFTADVLRRVGDARLRVVQLAELEAGDPDLQAAQQNRSRVEYYFTLSPCWPRWLLLKHREIARLTYLDADLFCFGSPARVGTAMDETAASVVITPHAFPWWLSYYEQHGRFNVGVLAFRNDAAGLACLEDWRARCLAWCHDRVEPDRYADQKYLDAWPARWGSAVRVLDDVGINLAPWNWAGRSLEADPAGLRVNGVPLAIFHFARFRPRTADGRWWQSGQLDYGVMPQRWRDALYTPYWRALCEARAALRTLAPEVDFPRAGARRNRAWVRALPLRVVFGGDWLRLGDQFYNLRGGVGRWSGRVLAMARHAVKRGPG